MNWISADDRLPEEYKCYIIATKDGYVTAATYMPWCKYWVDIVEEYERFCDVTYWMPMPEPPNREVEE